MQVRFRFRRRFGLLKVTLMSAATALVLGLLPILAQAAPVVVLMSTSGDLKPGDVRDSGEVISLSAGQTVMLNDATGQTRQLDGPYNGPLGGSSSGGSDASVVESLARLVAKRADNQSKVGAIRGDGGQASDPSLISVAQFGPQCLEATSDLVLWRPKPQPAPMRMQIMDLETGASAEVTWEPADRTLPWPAAAFGQDGGRYWVFWPDHETTQKSTEIQLHITQPLANPAERAAWMDRTGCERQALIVVEKMFPQ